MSVDEACTVPSDDLGDGTCCLMVPLYDGATDGSVGSVALYNDCSVSACDVDGTDVA